MKRINKNKILININKNKIKNKIQINQIHEIKITVG